MKDDTIYLKHIFDAVKKVEKYLKGHSFDDFTNNEMLFDAVVREIEIIGEASSRLSEKFRNEHQDLPVKLAIAMRNQLIHGYSEINPKIVWQTCQEDILKLKEQIKKII